MRKRVVTGWVMTLTAATLPAANAAVNFTGVDLTAVSSPAGQNFPYTVEGSSETGTLNVRLIEGDVSSVQTGQSPDLFGFYALQNVNNLTPATFRFSFDVARTFRVDQNETLTDIERNTFTLPSSQWDVLSSSNAVVTETGPSVSFLGTIASPPFGTYSIRGSGAFFDFQIVNSNAFPIAGSAISLSVVPEPTAAAIAALLAGGLAGRRRRGR